MLTLVTPILSAASVLDTDESAFLDYAALPLTSGNSGSSTALHARRNLARQLSLLRPNPAMNVNSAATTPDFAPSPDCSRTGFLPRQLNSAREDESRGTASTHNIQALEEHLCQLQSQLDRFKNQGGP